MLEGIAIGEYDFADLGGSIGTINLNMISTGSIPAGARIYRAYIEIETSPTSSTNSATVKCGTTEFDSACYAPWLVSSIGWTPTGVRTGLPIETSLTLSSLTTTSNYLTMTIATEDLTAGKFRVVAFWYKAY